MNKSNLLITWMKRKKRSTRMWLGMRNGKVDDMEEVGVILLLSALGPTRILLDIIWINYIIAQFFIIISKVIILSQFHNYETITIS